MDAKARSSSADPWREIPSALSKRRMGNGEWGIGNWEWGMGLATSAAARCRAVLVG